jgi:uridylate kinase
MTNGRDRDRVIISVSGSLIVPNGGIAVEFLRTLNVFIRDQLTQHPKRQFFLVIGGGMVARHYIEAGREVVEHELSGEDLDWLGVHATRLNAHLVRTIFRDIAHPQIIKDYDIIRKAQEPVVVAAGWKPGWSTDYCAILLAEDYREDTVINLGVLKQLYDKDPKKHADAQVIERIRWEDFRKIIGDDKWTPGMHAPFDPIAACRAEDLGVRVVILTGTDFENVEKYLRNESFVGTVIE